MTSTLYVEFVHIQRALGISWRRTKIWLRSLAILIMIAFAFVHSWTGLISASLSAPLDADSRNEFSTMQCETQLSDFVRQLDSVLAQDPQTLANIR